ncbi:MAG: bifunctional folylpolyglutamate synthase/dihydrofolate synthase [Lachnospiraceae bacterium]|nr:bifunctional folylpolyglutamate synthase/dihydrofolate synthase [Lachnospiraceae bacterium]
MVKQIIATYKEAVEYLYDVPRFTKKNSVEDTQKFLKVLGSPDKSMKIIHVAGTNGKGSVCAYLRGILKEAGYRCGVFTSPHLVEPTERFRIDDREISKEEFLQAFLQVYEALDWDALSREEGYHPTFFEYLFFMAMLIFQRAELDFCILETGLGGRLDATNAVSNKELTIITKIGLDHTEYLGTTLREIAWEKAGIIREGVPLVYWDGGDEATVEIQSNCEKRNVSAHPVSKKDYTYLDFQNKSIDFSYHSRYYNYISLCLRTIARYQMDNATLAIRSIEVLDQGKTVTKEHIVAGIQKAFWAGRMEEVRPDFFVDGAHNADGIEAFLDTVRADGYEGERILLCSVVKDKDYTLMIREMAKSGLFHKAFVAQMQSYRAIDPLKLVQLWKQHTGQELSVFDTVQEAVETLLAQQTDSQRIYAAGSLYLVGEIKEMLERC